MRARSWLWGRGGRRALCSGGAGGVPGAVQPYEAIPRDGRNRWLNLYRVWRSGGFQDFHHRMEGSFQRLGPVYRERVGTYDCVNVLLPRDAAQLFRAEGPFPRRMGIEAWSAHRRLRNHKCGLFLLNGQAWRSDRLALNPEVLSPAGARKFLPLLDAVACDFAAAMRRRVRESPGRALTLDLHPLLFRFTLEASSYALYGERLGLLGGAAAGGAQRFLGAVETMLRTTLPLLFLPPPLLRRLHPPLWRDHLRAWDTIFQHADQSIQRMYREFCRGGAGGPGGILAELLLRGRLPLDSIKANVTEFTAGGVDTVDGDAAAVHAVRAGPEPGGAAGAAGRAAGGRGGGGGGPAAARAPGRAPAAARRHQGDPAAVPGGHHGAAVPGPRRGAAQLPRARGDAVPGGPVRHGPQPGRLPPPRALRPLPVAGQGRHQLQGVGLRLRRPPVHRPPPRRVRDDALPHARLAQLHHRGGVHRGHPHCFPLHPHAREVAPAHLPEPRLSRGGPKGGSQAQCLPPRVPPCRGHGGKSCGDGAVGQDPMVPMVPKAWWEVVCKSHANELPQGLMGAEPGTPDPQ